VLDSTFLTDEISILENSRSYFTGIAEFDNCIIASTNHGSGSGVGIRLQPNSQGFTLLGSALVAKGKNALSSAIAGGGNVEVIGSITANPVFSELRSKKYNLTSSMLLPQSQEYLTMGITGAAR